MEKGPKRRKRRWSNNKKTTWTISCKIKSKLCAPKCVYAIHSKLFIRKVKRLEYYGNFLSAHDASNPYQISFYASFHIFIFNLIYFDLLSSLLASWRNSKACVSKANTLWIFLFMIQCHRFLHWNHETFSVHAQTSKQWKNYVKTPNCHFIDSSSQSLCKCVVMAVMIFQRIFVLAWASSTSIRIKCSMKLDSAGNCWTNFFGYSKQQMKMFLWENILFFLDFFFFIL